MEIRCHRIINIPHTFCVYRVHYLSSQTTFDPQTGFLSADLMSPSSSSSLTSQVRASIDKHINWSRLGPSPYISTFSSRAKAEWWVEHELRDMLEEMYPDEMLYIEEEPPTDGVEGEEGQTALPRHKVQIMTVRIPRSRLQSRVCTVFQVSRAPSSASSAVDQSCSPEDAPFTSSSSPVAQDGEYLFLHHIPADLILKTEVVSLYPSVNASRPAPLTGRPRAPPQLPVAEYMFSSNNRPRHSRSARSHHPSSSSSQSYRTSAPIPIALQSSQQQQDYEQSEHSASADHSFLSQTYPATSGKYLREQEYLSLGQYMAGHRYSRS